ncbi:MAG: 50S ribosomal protein L6 [Terriglobia bacterium]
MSRVGNKPITVPTGVTVDVSGSSVSVKGPKGNLSRDVPGRIEVVVDNAQVLVKRDSDEKEVRAAHGLTRALIANMVTGVSEGFQRGLEIAGVGYRATAKGNSIELRLGYSHPVVYAAPDGIELEVPAPTKIVVKGNDKQLVGDVAAKIRSFRKPEPYKRKGIRYEGEYVRHKVGKTAKA